MRIYFTGHRSFENRGCEAIVKATVRLIKNKYPNATFLVPSRDLSFDTRQWPDFAFYDVTFVSIPNQLLERLWVNIQSLPIKRTKKLVWPFGFHKRIIKDIASVDIVLSIGGDNYSLDYKLPSPQLALDGLALSLGKPVVLWGASVGPFEQEPDFFPVVKKHLSLMTKIIVRETMSLHYLANDMNLHKTILAVDPAFFLPAQSPDDFSFWPKSSSSGVIGINISPTWARFVEGRESILGIFETFIQNRLSEGFSILLLPHVCSIKNNHNDDFNYMTKLNNRFVMQSDKVSIAPAHLNAGQLKAVIKKTRFFIGARTHATIAAASYAIPTISLAYSRKARGINNDLFGDDTWVLPASKTSSHSLEQLFCKLLNQEMEVRQKLRDTLQTLLPSMGNAIEHLSGLVGGTAE